MFGCFACTLREKVDPPYSGPNLHHGSGGVQNWVFYVLDPRGGLGRVVSCFGARDYALLGTLTEVYLWRLPMQASSATESTIFWTLLSLGLPRLAQPSRICVVLIQPGLHSREPRCIGSRASQKERHSPRPLGAYKTWNPFPDP